MTRKKKKKNRNPYLARYLVTLGEWSGEGSKITETFITQTDRWEMGWNIFCDDKSVATEGNCTAGNYDFAV